MLSVVMLSVTIQLIMPSVDMLSVIMLSVAKWVSFTMSVAIKPIMQSVIIMIVVAPHKRYL